MNSPLLNGLFHSHVANEQTKESVLEQTTPLHLAVYFKRYDLIRYIITLMAIDTPDVNGKTPLMVAVEHGDYYMVEELIKKGADPCIKDSKGVCPITAAMRHGYAIIALLLLPFCDDVLQLSDAKGYSVLHYCCFCNNILLCDKIAELTDLTVLINDNCNNSVSSPLHIAAFAGSPLCCQWLIRHGAEANVENEMGETPLIDALKRNHVECVDVLLSYCNAHIPDNYGQLPLHHAAAHCSKRTVENVIEANPGAVACSDTHGNFPFHCAMMNNDTSVLEIFLANRKVLLRGNSYGLTPLHLATILNKTESMRVILQMGCPVNQKSMRGSTPFLVAAAHNSVEAMEVLFNYDPSVIADKDSIGCNVFHYIAQTGAIEAAEWSYQLAPEIINKPNIQGEAPLHYATLSGKVDIIELLIEWGVDKEATTKEKRTPYFYGVMGGWVQSLEGLPIQKTKDYYGMNVFHVACALGHPHIVKTLCEKIPEMIDYVDPCERTPLHIAVIYNDAISTKLLIDNGCNKTKKDIRSLDALKSALHRGNIHCYELILGVRPLRGSLIGRLISTTKSIGGDGLLRFDLGDIIDIIWEHHSGWAFGINRNEVGLLRVSMGNVVALTAEERRVLDELLSFRKFGKRNKKNRSLSLPEGDSE